MISQGVIFNLSDTFISAWELEKVVVIWASSLVKRTTAYGIEVWLGHYKSIHVKKHTQKCNLEISLDFWDSLSWLLNCAYALSYCASVEDTLNWSTKITALLPPMQHHKVSSQEGASGPHWSGLLHLEMDSFLRQSGITSHPSYCTESHNPDCKLCCVYKSMHSTEAVPARGDW